MAAHPSLNGFLVLILGILLAVQVIGGPLDAGAFSRVFDAPTQQLEKRDGDGKGELQKLWNSVKDKDKINTGTAKGYMLYPDKGSEAAVYAPTAFYGCTLVVIVNGHGVVIGHFAQESPGPDGCTTMTDPKAVKNKLIPTLNAAEDETDMEDHDDTMAWIVYSDDVPKSAPGYKAIMDDLTDHMGVRSENIKPLPYRRGVVGGNSDKLAVKWAPMKDGTGANLTVYIRSDTPQFFGMYDCNGNPKSSSKYRRDVSACAPTATVAPISSSTPTPSPTVAPADPPAKASCVANPTTAVKDSHEDELQKAAKYFCDEYASSTVTTANVNIAHTIISGTVDDGLGFEDIARPYTGTDNEDDVYEISVMSVDGCTPNGGFNLATPVAQNQCPDLLHSAWQQCNNQGRGGSIAAGCLVYSISTRY